MPPRLPNTGIGASDEGSFLPHNADSFTQYP